MCSIYKHLKHRNVQSEASLKYQFNASVCLLTIALSSLILSKVIIEIYEMGFVVFLHQIDNKSLFY